MNFTSVIVLLALFQVGETGPSGPRVSDDELTARHQRLSSSSVARPGRDSGSEILSSTPVSRTESGYSQLDEANNMLRIGRAQVWPRKEVTVSAGIQGELTRLRIDRKDPVTGEEVSIEVREGVNVNEGEILGTIYDAIELRQIAAANALLRVARAEQNKTIEIEYALASLSVALAEEERNRLMNARTPNTISAQMVLEAKLRRVQTEKQHERAKYDLLIIKPAETEVKEAELAIAETRLEQRRLVAPVTGIVDAIYGHEGMWFREGSEILKITQYDTLLIHGKVNIHHAPPRKIDGKTVTVFAPPIGKEEGQMFTGKVTYVSQTIEGDNHYKIHVEVKNQLKDGYWLLNPGRYVDLQIKL